MATEYGSAPEAMRTASGALFVCLAAETIRVVETASAASRCSPGVTTLRWHDDSGAWHAQRVSDPQPIHGGAYRYSQVPLWILLDRWRVNITWLHGRYSVYSVFERGGQEHDDSPKASVWIAELDLPNHPHWALIHKFLRNGWTSGAVPVQPCISHGWLYGYEPRVGPTAKGS
jgi:hypothetical protein